MNSRFYGVKKKKDILQELKKNNIDPSKLEST